MSSLRSWACWLVGSIAAAQPIRAEEPSESEARQKWVVRIPPYRYQVTSGIDLWHMIRHRHAFYRIRYRMRPRRAVSRGTGTVRCRSCENGGFHGLRFEVGEILTLWSGKPVETVSKRSFADPTVPARAGAMSSCGLPLRSKARPEVSPYQG